MTAEATTPTITLPIATAFAVEPARLVAWLAEHGWHECSSSDPGYRTFERDGSLASFAVDGSTLGAFVQAMARSEGLEPHALASLLVAPVDGPALQWEHMSPSARAATTAAIAALAHASRVDASVWRAVGNTESALAAEGRALGLEAAAGVLGRV